MHAESPEIIKATSHFNRTLVILEEMLRQVEAGLDKTTNWFVFAPMIGRKYLLQLHTLQQLLSNQEPKGKANYLIGASSVFVILRMQLETFAVFHHLFVAGTDVSEKIVRFRLWELDGIRTRARYTVPVDPSVVQKIKEEATYANEVEDVIRQTTYFQNLSVEKQNFLLNKACWRFTDSSLQQADKNNRRLSIEQLTRNTGLKPDLFQDWYSIYSMHAHTGYFSVVQQEQITEEEQWVTKFIALQQAIFLTCFLIKDFTRIFGSARAYFHSLPLKEQEAVISREQMGRLV